MTTRMVMMLMVIVRMRMVMVLTKQIIYPWKTLLPRYRYLARPPAVPS